MSVTCGAAVCGSDQILGQITVGRVAASFCGWFCPDREINGALFTAHDFITDAVYQPADTSAAEKEESVSL